MKIERVSFSSIAHLSSRAARDKVSLRDSRGTYWFRVLIDTDIAVVAGLMQVKSGYRIKGVWCDSKYRGRGYGKCLTDYLIEWCSNQLASHIEVYAYNASFYESRGFKAYGKLTNGATKLRKVL